MKKIITKIITGLSTTALLTTLSFTWVNAQVLTDNKFGKGIKIMAKDSSFSMKFSTRMQNRFEGTYIDGQDPAFKDKIYLRRARLKFGGFVLSPKVGYKMEFDVISGQVLDAVVKWNLAGNFYIWAGQTKLPGNRERVISSQQLQFVDRSLLNSKYTIDRDKGLQLRHSFKVGKMVVREIASLSLGEGKNYKSSSVGHDYTGRIEVLPFGKFTSKGDYSSSDLKREEKPKLALGVTYDYNDEAVKSGGQLGDVISESRDLSSVFADLMFKYKGLSIMIEYADKQASEGAAAILDSDDNVLEAYYTGTAINAQVGYLFKNNWEIATRYTTVTPETITGNNDLNQYTLGVSKYVVGHYLKMQGDISLLQEDGSDDELLFRLQVEVAF